MIQIIIHVLTSERDGYGNCYHAARITRTIDHASITVAHLGGESNATHFARNGGAEWEEIYTIAEVLPKRQWQRITREFDATREEVIADFVREAKHYNPALYVELACNQVRAGKAIASNARALLALMRGDHR